MSLNGLVRLGCSFEHTLGLALIDEKVFELFLVFQHSCVGLARRYRRGCCCFGSDRIWSTVILTNLADLLQMRRHVVPAWRLLKLDLQCVKRGAFLFMAFLEDSRD